jgi:hypothetical protein
LFICAKDLFVEATQAASGAGDDWATVVAGGNEELVGFG